MDGTMSDTVLGWHFVGSTLLDGRPVPADGEWLVHEGRLVLCESGLHGSEHPLDALRYAPGPVLCRCEFADIGERDTDKFVARRRRISAHL